MIEEILSISFLRNTFFTALMLAVMLAYLGVQVVRRRIVFVDLAVAQLSALGVALAVLLEFEPLSFSILFTLAGAALLSLPSYERRIPQEAVMGIVYAVASALAVLVIAKAPHGESEVLNLFFGNLLAAGPGQIKITILVFSGVTLLHGIFIFKFIHPFLGEKPDRENPVGEIGWNLLFYLTLAMVIAVSIRTAGVLLVFSDLVIPAVFALLFVRQLVPLIGLAMVFSVLGNGLGLMASYRFDLPTGPAIVATLGALLVLTAVLKFVFLRIWRGLRAFRIEKNQRLQEVIEEKPEPEPGP